MSSPARFPHQRRRSQSASSSIRGIDYSDGSDSERWRPSTKRALPSYARSPSYRGIASDAPPEKWDVDQWRRGKRARRDKAYHRSGRSEQHLPETTHIASWDSRKSSLGLPSTSAAFQLYPHHRKARRASAHLPSRRDGSVRKNIGRVPSEDLNRLRSDAFWELQRSVAESGEGLVRKMRDWENDRSRSSSSTDHLADPALRFSTRQNYETASDALMSPEGDEEEVEIVSCDVSQDPSYFQPRTFPHKKRAYSLGTMEVDFTEFAPCPQPFSPTEGSESCSSPMDLSCGVSSYSSDEEELDSAGPLVGPSCTPALSHTYSTSTNSSLVSLPLPPPKASHSALSTFSFSMPPPRSPKALHVPSTATRSEKALAALTLAMANGAGGLNDYGALRSAEDIPEGLDCDIGELWH